MMRLFLAIELSDKQKEELFNIAGQLRHVRKVPKHQLHITVKFLGEQASQDLHRIVETLTAIRYPAFDLQVNSVGSFGRSGRPGVIWAGISRSRELETLHKIIELSFKPFAAIEKRRFSPHITLARTQKDYNPLEAEDFLTQYKDFTLPPFSVKHLTLFESILSKHGAEHVKLARCELATT